MCDRFPARVRATRSRMPAHGAIHGAATAAITDRHNYAVLRMFCQSWEVAAGRIGQGSGRYAPGRRVAVARPFRAAGYPRPTG